MLIDFEQSHNFIDFTDSRNDDEVGAPIRRDRDGYFSTFLDEMGDFHLKWRVVRERDILFTVRKQSKRRLF